MTTTDSRPAPLLAVAADPAESLPLRVDALRRLSELPWQDTDPATAGPVLTELLSHDAAPQVRAAAGAALVALPGPDSQLPALRRLMDDEPDRKARRALATALHARLSPPVVALAAALAADPHTPAALRSAAHAVTRLRATAPGDLTKAVRLAYACEAAGRPEDAVAVARFALGVPFTGDYAVWSPVECALALLWWHAAPEQQAPLRRILDVGTADPEIARGPLRRRLDGGLLYADTIRSALAEGDDDRAATWAALQVQELTLLLAYGGSAAWPPERLTAHRATYLALVRKVHHPALGA